MRMKRLKPYLLKNRIEAGCDEAGRGCLAGPVTAAAVILDPRKPIKGLNDSKQLTEKLREELAPEIRANALAWAVAFVDAAEIDRINILKASILAMHKALDQLVLKPEHILVDGNRFYAYPDIEHTTVIKGDGIFQSIAAASILAKTARDAYMQQIHSEFPDYLWSDNKGYPTIAHRNAIARIGSCHYHRKSFTLLSPQLSLDLEAEL